MERHDELYMAGSLSLVNESKALRKLAPVTCGRLRVHKMLIRAMCSTDVMEYSFPVHGAAEPAALMKARLYL